MSSMKIKYSLFLPLSLFTLSVFLPVVQAQEKKTYPLYNDTHQMVQKVYPSDYFAPSQWSETAFKIETDPLKLMAVAKDTLRYLQEESKDTSAVTAGLLAEFGININDIKACNCYSVQEDALQLGLELALIYHLGYFICCIAAINLDFRG